MRETVTKLFATSVVATILRKKKKKRGKQKVNDNQGPESTISHRWS